MSDKTCGSCIFGDVAPSTSFVMCRRMPPQGGASYGSWPMVRNDNWCGEFKSKSKKPVLTLPGERK